MTSMVPKEPAEQVGSAASDHTFAMERLGFHSPADERLSALDIHEGVSPRAPLTVQQNPLLGACPPEALPQPVNSTTLIPGSAVTTPSQELHQPELAILAIDSSITFAGEHVEEALAVGKSSQALRLPSFELLGIAAPHPDRITSPSEVTPFLGAGPLSNPDDPLHLRDIPPGYPEDTRNDIVSVTTPELFRPNKDPQQHFVPVVTPPDETKPTEWGSFAHVSTVPMASPAQSDPENVNTRSAQTQSDDPPQAPAESSVVAAARNTFDGNSSWLEEATRTIVSYVRSHHDGSGPSVKVLSHALPCPSLDGHIFSRVIQAIHEQFPPQSTTWINVFHAVPGRFSVEDVPRSPPSTPGSAVGGDDYFTKKIFDSAVQVSDYQREPRLVPSSPFPVVEPSSIAVSIVERYIPPTNANEFAQLFHPGPSRSLLIDRLVELSPKHGALLFVYPTKSGGERFMNDYLGPVLDPVLRSMIVIHGLSADLSMALGRMSAVASLLDFDTMKTRMEGLCYHLTHNSRKLDRFHRRPANFSVTYAARKEVLLDRRVWTSDWWTKQEKVRIREAVAEHIRTARKLPEDAPVMATPLVNDLFDAVANQSYAGDGPREGVEVGVFVVLKTEQ